MEIIQNEEDIKLLKENKIIGNPNLKNTTISFYGKNNLLVCQDDVLMENCNFKFKQDNSLLFITETQDISKVFTQIGADSVIFIGDRNYYNSGYQDYSLSFHVGENKNIIIGNDCLFSFGIHLRTADPHLIYDANTKKRINPSKSIYIGDHVWLAQNVLVLKGTQIGSGSIIGGSSVVSNKILASNTSYAGNPVRKIKEHVFFLEDSANHYHKDDMYQNEVCDKNNFIYKKDENTLDIQKIEDCLTSLQSSTEKYEYLKKILVEKDSKNRFFIR